MERKATDDQAGMRRRKGLMTPTKWLATLLLAAAVGMVVPGDASAATTVYEFAECRTVGDDCGPKGQNDGSGNEQASAFTYPALDGSGDVFVGAILMSAKAIPNR